MPPRQALAAAGLEPSDIGLIIVATATPDNTFPASATKVQALIGTPDCIAFDVAAVCSGFLYAVSVADSMLRTARRKTCAGDRERNLQPHPRLGRPHDLRAVRRRGGGGRAVGEDVDDDRGILATRLHAEGKYAGMLYVDGGPSTTGTVGHVRMQGREVFRHAVTNLASVLGEVMADVGLSPESIDWVVPHQANKRIIDATAKKLGLPAERVVLTVDQHANTSAASVPLALDLAVRDGRIKRGDLVVLEAMGGGFTWGAAVLRV
jgi:3-oxoacyl-[acyl-carrier-protein] synthase-3